MKRSPLRRTGGLKPVSRKKRKQNSELDKLRPTILARSGGMCEVQASPFCWGGAMHLHHKLMRSQGGKDTPENLLAVCSWCHHLIHRYPARSYRNGWLIRTYPTREDT